MLFLNEVLSAFARNSALVLTQTYFVGVFAKLALHILRSHDFEYLDDTAALLAATWLVSAGGDCLLRR
jgi:hypothetical protein